MDKTARLAPIDAHRIPLEPHRRYIIPEAAALLRQAQSTTYLQIRRGDLRVIRDGGRTYVPGSEIIRRSTLPAA